MARVSATIRRREALRHQAAAKTNNHVLITVAGLLLTVAVGIALLALASARAGDFVGPDLSVRVLAIEFLVSAVILFVTSVNTQMRVSLQMIMIYMTVYLLLPGFHHASRNIFPFYDMSYPEEIRLRAAGMIAAFIIALMVGYIFGDQSRRIGKNIREAAAEVVFPNKILLVLFTAAAVAVTGAYLAVAGLSGAFGVRGAAAEAVDGLTSVGLLITLPRTVTLIVFAYCYTLTMRARQAGVGLYFLLINAPLFFITNFPLSLARYYLFGIVLFFVVQTVNLKTIFARGMMAFGFVFGALFAMPYVDTLTRHRDQVIDPSFQASFERYLNSGDFDGLQSIQNAIIFVDVEGKTHGRQLLSAALFFVPRSIWEGKGEPTGVITSQAAGFKFNNISQPLPSEFYVDFGIIGVVVLTLALGFALARLDRWIDRRWEYGPRARLVAGVVVAYAIILMRGTLLGIVAPIATFILGVAIVIIVGLRKREEVVGRATQITVPRRTFRRTNVRLSKAG